MYERISIKKLAELAGVSIGTIDRVLNNRNGVSEKTAKRVRALIEETGYKKNTVASRLKLAEKSSIRIFSLLPSEAKKEGHYWTLPLKGIEKAIDELLEMGVQHKLLTFEMGDAQSFINAFHLILSERPHALITVPYFQERSSEFSKQAKKLNIPIVYIDTQKKIESQNEHQIIQDSFQSGKVAARILSQIIQHKGSYIVLNLINNITQLNNLEREAGFRTFFQDYDQVNQWDIHSFTVYQTKLDSLKLYLSPFVNALSPLGVFVTNSKSFLLPEILDELGLSNRTTIIGYDLNPNNTRLLKSNKIHFIINQKPESQGHLAVKGLFKFLTEGDSSELNYSIPVEIIVKENLTN